MRNSISDICLVILLTGVLLGCQSTDNEKGANSSQQGNTSNADANSEVRQHEYRAVCIEEEAHGGNRQMLTRWLDSREKAEDYGREHGDFKYKGHRWIIEERVKK